MTEQPPFIVIAIRDYPTMPIGWRGSYFVGFAQTLDVALEIAHEEVVSRGGKYGCVIFNTNTGNQVGDPAQ